MRAALAGEPSVGAGAEVSIGQTNELSIFSPSFIAAIELADQPVSQTGEDVGMFSGSGEVGQLIRIVL